MRIKRAQLGAIVRGAVMLAFRRWQRATAAVGILAIDSVARATLSTANQPGIGSRGGYGGQDLVQIHTVTGTEPTILLPPAKTLEHITISNAFVLLTETIS